ncbi:MAG TPA: ATP-binding protein [Leptolyngbya sp.]|jgi:PAS domain S-box-containing protein|nr:ATP-binding protein [Leptolyngbya sp.]
MDGTGTNYELHTQIQYRLIEQLSESERRYRELLESLQEIVFRCDQVGCLTFLNIAWAKILGYSVPESLNQPLVHFLHADDRDRGMQLFAQLQNQQTVIAEELRFQHQSGAIIWLELSARPTNRNETSGSLTNITDRKRVEEVLHEVNEALEGRVEQRTVELQQALQDLGQTQAKLLQTEKMSSLGQLVAGVAHEINNPVNFIHANLIYVQEYAQSLLRLVKLYQTYYPNPAEEIQVEADEIDLEFLQADLGKVITSMTIGTTRICQIVLSLRNFSRIDEAEFKAVNIHEGIDSTLMLLQHRLKASSGHPPIEVIRDYVKLPNVECYPGRLNQVFMNILSNAIDAIEGSPQPQITIQTSINDQWVKVAIADNGIGMPEEVQAKIFDPFFTTKPVGKGTGMGMSISYQIIVEQHRGKLEGLSAEGKGTEFLIQIPIRQC